MASRCDCARRRATFFSQSGLGITPNIAPPSKKHVCRPLECEIPGSPSFNVSLPSPALRRGFRSPRRRIIFRSATCAASASSLLFAEVARRPPAPSAAFPAIAESIPSSAPISRALRSRGFFEMLAEKRDLRRQFLDALAFGGDRAHYRRLPAVTFRHELQDRLQLLLEAVGAFAIDLFRTKMSPISIRPAFRLCTSSPMPGIKHHERAIGQPHDFDFALTHAHRLDQNHIFSGRVEEQRRVSRGLRQSAEKSARGHGADEDVRVGGVALHADAVAENRAAGERAGGIHGDDADAFFRRRDNAPARRSTSVLLPVPGAPVMPIAICMAGVRKKLAQDFFGFAARDFRWPKPRAKSRGRLPRALAPPNFRQTRS